MIYPTSRAAGLAAAIAPAAVALGFLAPQAWALAPAALALLAALVFADAALGARRGDLDLALEAPEAIPAGLAGEARVALAFAGARPPRRVELTLEADDRLGAPPGKVVAMMAAGRAEARLALKPVRRGQGALRRLWVRWRGPLGLVWKQRRETLDRSLAVTLNLHAVKDEAMRLFSRDSPTGARLQRDLGGGAEFHALRDFQVGMDHRTIDWKQSARHGVLLAKEFHVERNHHVMAVIDTGRLMCEPVLGLPRLDHALNAALLLAYVSLKTGDMAGLFAFDARPGVAAVGLSGAGAFGQIQRLAARVDYTAQETNYTLGLTQLGARLRRRSLLVVFTEFADSTSAELMLETVGRLLEQHLVLFVILRDEELEALQAAAPATPEDVSRAGVAAALARERDLVVERLQRMGALILETSADHIGPALISRYLELKRQDRL